MENGTAFYSAVELISESIFDRALPAVDTHNRIWNSITQSTWWLAEQQKSLSHSLWDEGLAQKITLKLSHLIFFNKDKIWDDIISILFVYCYTSAEF